MKASTLPMHRWARSAKGGNNNAKNRDAEAGGLAVSRARCRELAECYRNTSGVARQTTRRT